MNSEDFFKRFFFGSSPSNSDLPFNQNNQNDKNENLHPDENFDHQMHSFFFNDVNRMMNEMDQMMRSFHFGAGFNFGFGNQNEGQHFGFEFVPDSNHHQVPAIEQPKTKRDEFLKPNMPSNDNDRSLVPSNSKSYFERFFNSIHPSDKHTNENLDQGRLKDDKFYEDLDEKIAKEGLDRVLKEDIFKNDKSSLANKFARETEPVFSSFGQSVSIKRMQRPDGSVEEIKTIRSSDGNEEKVTTRLIGNKKHSVIEKKSANNGITETEEIFENFDQNSIEDFNKMWSKQNNANKNIIIPETNRNNNQINAQTSKTNINESSSSILSKLYSWFK